MEFILVITGFLWAMFLFYVYKAQKDLQSIDEVDLLTSPPPKISIILAVKDGEQDLRDSLPRLTSMKLNLEIIVVNDRSTDGTLNVMNEFNVKNVTINDLPDGWLGKVHALHEGVKHATGDYLLFMDPDIRINEAILLRALSVCESRSLDHLAILPDTKRGEYGLNIMMMTSKLLFTWSARPWLSIEKRPLKCIKGVGAFNFVRTKKFLETEGFEWLKMDVADDVALSQLIAKNGGRSLLMKAGTEGPSLDWYKDFNDLVKGLEKNIVGGFTNYRIPMIVLMSTGAIMTLLFHYSPLAILSTIIFAFSLKKYIRYTWIELFSFPLGIALLGLILIRSSIICFRNGGICWSGTFYPLKRLKEGSRVILGI
jgi:glycosyltransferase involved in cell wall biosynthesis